MSNNQAPAAVEKKHKMTGKQFASTYGSLVALIVMIGYDPLGNYLTRYLGNTRFFYLQLPELARFLREDMNGTVFRALQIGVYIASLAVSWRIWLGIEDHLSEGEEAK